jgi:L-amino acid N-acyltransferase YncA
MSSSRAKIQIRPLQPTDVATLLELLNEIVRAGGTTAIETPLTESEFCGYFTNSDNHLFCHVAVDDKGLLTGFQSLQKHPNLPADWADIATYARRNPVTPGVGTALFEETRRQAVIAGIPFINATIRADNVGGLAYYSRIGFVDYSIEKAVPLKDGTPVNRISKKYTHLVDQ